MAQNTSTYRICGMITTYKSKETSPKIFLTLPGVLFLSKRREKNPLRCDHVSVCLSSKSVVCGFLAVCMYSSLCRSFRFGPLRGVLVGKLGVVQKAKGSAGLGRGVN